MSVTIADVAKLANVGAGTVSRVLNGSKSVSEETRAQVLACIQQLGYRPNLVARGLAAKRTGMVAAIIPSIGYTQHAEAIQGLSDFLHEHGLRLMIGHCGYSAENEARIVSDFLERRPDAFYLTGTSHTADTRRMLRQSGIPVVEAANLTDDPIDCVVGYDNFDAARQVVHLLHARGHRNIAVATSLHDPNDRTAARRDGYLAACADLGIDMTERLIACTNSFAGGAAAVAQVARLSPAIDLLVCVTDVIAVGAILECQRRGIAVPGQLGVCGFDDLPIAAAINPALTTIGVDRVGMGRTAGQVLLQRLGGAAAMSGSVDVGFDIREHASTRSEISAPGEGATKELRE
ncbi:MAG: LacI family DNA-binding transcriptional regulator [Acetobacteraceae bacterium]|nr:LacI family DNA-binding transcriptional regulator [Acetobacteraceae bacterium]